MGSHAVGLVVFCRRVRLQHIAFALAKLASRAMANLKVPAQIIGKGAVVTVAAVELVSACSSWEPTCYIGRSAQMGTSKKQWVA
jgi:hypothetical protein